MAPECMEDLQFSTASDVWSFGVFMWELFHPKEKHPYPGMKNTELRLKVSTGYTMEPPEVSHELASIPKGKGYHMYVQVVMIGVDLTD